MKGEDVDEEFRMKSAVSKSSFLLACFCPCFVMAHIRSTIKRERLFICSQAHTIGTSGAIECFNTAILAAIGWPLSPVLGWYLVEQRNLWTIMYFGKPSQSSCSRLLNMIFNWPTTLLEHRDFVERRKIDGILRFDWEEDKKVLSDILSTPPPVRDINVVLIGPDDAGKTQLMYRLLQITKSGKGVQRNEPKKERGWSIGGRVEENDNMTGDEGFEIEQIDKNESAGIKFGMKCVSVSSNAIAFLQVWDVPEAVVETDINNTVLNDVLGRANVVAFVFNSRRGESFARVKKFYEILKNQLVLSRSTVKLYFIANRVEDGAGNVSPKGETIHGNKRDHKSRRDGTLKFVSDEQQSSIASSFSVAMVRNWVERTVPGSGDSFLELSGLSDILKARRRMIGDARKCF